MLHIPCTPNDSQHILVQSTLWKISYGQRPSCQSTYVHTHTATCSSSGRGPDSRYGRCIMHPHVSSTPSGLAMQAGAQIRRLARPAATHSAKQALQDLPLLNAAAGTVGGTQRRPPTRQRAPWFRLARRGHIHQLALRGWSPGAPQRRGPPALVRFRARIRQVPSTPAADSVGLTKSFASCTTVASKSPVDLVCISSRNAFAHHAWNIAMRKEEITHSQVIMAHSAITVVMQ